MPTISRLLPVLVVGAVLATVLGVTMVSAGQPPEECATSGPTLHAARASYAESCSLPRIDCDPIDGIWYCSSRVIGNAAPGGVTADEVGSSNIGTGTSIVVTVPSTAGPSTTEAPTTGPSSTEASTTLVVTQPPTSGSPSTTPTTPPTSAPPTTVPGGGGCVAIEAEDLALNGAWRVVSDGQASGGRYITWEGLGPERNNSRPTDVISTKLVIGQPGTYRFTWAMRQPDGVASDRANDSWLNVPDAARFGPVGGGSYPGFIKVFGNSTGQFRYSATADVNHNKSTIAIVFDRAGTYTLQIAGRSHGHQIDRIVIHHDSVSRADAIAGRSGACDRPPTTSPSTAPPTTAPPTTAPPSSVSTSPTTRPGTCGANTTGRADLGRDLISLHYDHAPDRDDGHATVAGREVATKLGFTPWVVGGAYGADNRRTYNPNSEPVMDATWGRGNWVNAHANWSDGVSRTADRWQQTLAGCGDIWIAEGGQSDFSADVVRELIRRMPDLDTKERIHLIQHSNWNERMALDADLQYVRANTDYVKIPDGNNGGNGSADFNDVRYNGPFIDLALAGRHRSGWSAAFDYYNPRAQRLDFSDTVELLHIVGVGTGEVANIEQFANRFIR